MYMDTFYTKGKSCETNNRPLCTGIRSFSQLEGIFKLLGHVCMENNYIPME